MPRCTHCGQALPEGSRFCIHCGRPVPPSAGETPDGREAEQMNMPALVVMVACLVLAVLVPPWETPPGQPPEFLGFHSILSPPEDGIISRGLVTVELTTIAVAGFYVSWLLRSRPKP